MGRKTKGRQKIEMTKMKNESNLQVTFSKRKYGLFKKASELCTLYDAEIAVIMFSPAQKVFSFGHPNVQTVIDRFLNNNPPPPHQHSNMQLSEMRQNSIIRDLNNQLTQVLNEIESEEKRNKELKKVRKNSKMPENWWKDPIEGFNLAQANIFRGNLENLKKTVTFEASKLLQATGPHQNFYVGSSSNSPFDDNGGNNFNPYLDQFNQRTMMNMNAFYNQNPILPSHALPFGNNNHGNTSEGFVPEYNMNYIQECNENQNMSLKTESTSQNEHHHDGHPPHSRSD